MYLIIINIATFIIYGLDKYFAIHDMWRISEKALLGLAIAGGSVGAYAGMYTFRHKTKHQLFMIGVPVIFVMQVAVFELMNNR